MTTMMGMTPSVPASLLPYSAQILGRGKINRRRPKHISPPWLMIEMIVMKKRDIMEHLLLHWWSATIGATADDDDGGDDDDDKFEFTALAPIQHYNSKWWTSTTTNVLLRHCCWVKVSFNYIYNNNTKQYRRNQMHCSWLECMAMQRLFTALNGGLEAANYSSKLCKIVGNSTRQCKVFWEGLRKDKDKIVV